uniref:Uncharacterized protein n=1 Tax=Arundo donax TaxID=35708 RepID=A0A0A9CC66_ARUDO
MSHRRKRPTNDSLAETCRVCESILSPPLGMRAASPVSSHG